MVMTPRRGQSQPLATNASITNWIEFKRDRQLLDKLDLVKKPLIDARSTHDAAKYFESNWFL